MQLHIYIKEKDGVYEFFETTRYQGLTRKEAHLYLIYMKPSGGNSYQFHVKLHEYGKFHHTIYISGVKNQLPDKLKTSLLLYGFTIPSPEEYINGTRFTLR